MLPCASEPPGWGPLGDQGRTGPHEISGLERRRTERLLGLSRRSRVWTGTMSSFLPWRSRLPPVLRGTQADGVQTSWGRKTSGAEGKDPGGVQRRCLRLITPGLWGACLAERMARSQALESHGSWGGMSLRSQLPEPLLLDLPHWKPRQALGPSRACQVAPRAVQRGPSGTPRMGALGDPVPRARGVGIKGIERGRNGSYPECPCPQGAHRQTGCSVAGGPDSLAPVQPI